MAASDPSASILTSSSPDAPGTWVAHLAALLDSAALDAIDAEAGQLIDEAVAEARAAAPPDPASVADDVYVDY